MVASIKKIFEYKVTPYIKSTGVLENFRMSSDQTIQKDLALLTDLALLALSSHQYVRIAENVLQNLSTNGIRNPIVPS